MPSVFPHIVVRSAEPRKRWVAVARRDGGVWRLFRIPADMDTARGHRTGIMAELSVLQEAQMREHGSADFRQALNGFQKMAIILEGPAYMEAIARPESRRCSKYIGAARADVAAAVSSAPSSLPAISAAHPQRVGTTAPPA
jgi:hypothetical protein